MWYNIAMGNIQWIFDGIGTSIVSLILGVIIGGGVGYKIGISKTVIKQEQKAGDNSNLSQIGEKHDG
jgi:hypothetical protein